MILRSLACLLFQNPTGSIPKFDREFLLFLDAGSACDGLAALASRYHLDWWNSDITPSKNGILNMTTLAACIEIHREVIVVNGPRPARVTKTVEYQALPETPGPFLE
jgi:hypothetical protein